MAEINAPVFVDGTLSAGNIVCGEVTVDLDQPNPGPGEGGYAGSADVTGLSIVGSGDLLVQATPMTMVPTETLNSVSISATTSSSFTVHVHRSNQTTTRVFWMAMRNP